MYFYSGRLYWRFSVNMQAHPNNPADFSRQHNLMPELIKL
ncbi:MAG: hemopexin repeat-containing protein [Mucilaginibacter sp.]